ncbi:045R [Cherax quadricarinatus iridovirus]|uniref:Uncharacterized protein n=1 Tax=Shrimp hemocyte iridescent virus TaxID=2039780 RepID=A0A291B0U6_9VIRU|nr:045R [Cherax quadricarinatus iridovirus]YP_010084859.1 hypothetical protein KM509_gp107 [Shrimp hemocyte iridescent virus]UPA43363.1 hypothetical protein 4TH000089 [Iridovirus CN01]ASZ85025.1 045R [Cherax quadricarinatus iridovirus]ATE87116.1 hypothetical protein [Shrimp hemocyte iridescent virus]UPA43439.1 hypothetical protein 3TG000006 [Iridovirus CN01]UPA43633.1 hypothetical protein 1DG000041 [Iridovirus CN01]
MGNSVSNSTAVCGVFDDATIEKMEIFGIQSPKKIKSWMMEYYEIPTDFIIEDEYYIPVGQFTNYVKIIIFSYIFKIGKRVMLGEGGELIPFDNAPHGEDFENILEENRIFDEFDSEALIRIAEEIDSYFETMCEMELITPEQSEEYSGLINTHIIFPKHDEDLEREYWGEGEDDDEWIEYEEDSDYVSDFESDKEEDSDYMSDLDREEEDDF